MFDALKHGCCRAQFIVLTKQYFPTLELYIIQRKTED
jgi:hypothetical protein